MARMPLKFRSTGMACSSDETSKDCTAWSGDCTIGYIYYRAPELLQGPGRRPRRATHLDMVDARSARQAAGNARPWHLADACIRTSESGRELAGVVEMGAPRGARASRVKTTKLQSGNRSHACAQ